MSEKGEIRRIGARPQKNSGRGKMQKGDATWHGFLIDVKEYAKGFRITVDNWAKICTDAIRHNKEPILLLVLEHDNRRIRLAVLEWSVLEAILDDHRAG